MAPFILCAASNEFLSTNPSFCDGIFLRPQRLQGQYLYRSAEASENFIFQRAFSVTSKHPLHIFAVLDSAAPFGNELVMQIGAQFFSCHGHVRWQQTEDLDEGHPGDIPNWLFFTLVLFLPSFLPLLMQSLILITSNTKMVILKDGKN